VFDELMMHTGLGGLHRVDHVGFRWDAADIELVMVEVKPGDKPNDAANALGQAVAYQCAADLVWIAAEGDIATAEAGSLGVILEHLGLGYLIAQRDSRKSAHETIEPQPSATRSLPLLELNVARVRMLHLFDELGAITSARDRRPDAWAVLNAADGWQIAGAVWPNGKTVLSLLAEQADAGRRAAQTCNAARLADVVRAQAPDSTLVVQQRVHDGRRPHYSAPEVWTAQMSDASLAALVARAKAMNGPRTSPQFQLSVPLWEAGERLDHVTARGQLEAAIERTHRLLRSAWL
jgi:hypothetical protein